MKIIIDDESKTVKIGYIEYGEEFYNIFKKTNESEWNNLITSFIGIQTSTGREDYQRFFNLHKGDTILDCGAHIGINTRDFAKIVGPTGTVIVMEPDYRALGANISNSFNFKNIIYLPIGAWYINEIIPMGLCVEKFLGRSHLGDYQKHDTSATPIRVMRVDDLLEQLKIPKVNFIKMDIEAAEVMALKGMENTLKECDGFGIACYHVLFDKKGDRIRTRNLIEPYLRELLPDCDIKVWMGIDGEILSGCNNKDRLKEEKK